MPNDFGLDFPAFGRGLSLRLVLEPDGAALVEQHFPAFGRGLSLRPQKRAMFGTCRAYFPAFGRGLSLRHRVSAAVLVLVPISPPSGGDFH